MLTTVAQKVRTSQELELMTPAQNLALSTSAADHAATELSGNERVGLCHLSSHPPAGQPTTRKKVRLAA